MLQISFDRYLLPTTITRQSYAILDSKRQLLGNVLVRTLYDPVARIVTIAGPDGVGTPWLTPDQNYYLVLPTPTDPKSDLGGFRAIDRAPLGNAQEHIFRATAATGAKTFEPVVDFCGDVLPIFTLKCNNFTCHGAGEPDRNAAGLGLTTVAAVRDTAVGQVAHGANTGSRATSPAEPIPGLPFGLDMAIIKPNDPGSSWLVYKMELVPPSTATAPAFSCGASSAPDFTTTLPLASGDRDRLSDYVLGNAMPFPSDNPSYAYQPLTFQEREKVRLWITQGATLHDCRACAY